MQVLFNRVSPSFQIFPRSLQITPIYPLNAGWCDSPPAQFPKLRANRRLLENFAYKFHSTSGGPRTTVRFDSLFFILFIILVLILRKTTYKNFGATQPAGEIQQSPPIIDSRATTAFTRIRPAELFKLKISTFFSGDVGDTIPTEIKLIETKKINKCKNETRSIERKKLRENCLIHEFG